MHWWELASALLITSSLVRMSPHVLLLHLQLSDRAREFVPVFMPVSFIDIAVLHRSEFTTSEDPLLNLPSLVLV
jgi:hypothetical protein